MLIENFFKKWNIRPTGIIHIGAHRCEERDIYLDAGCDDSRVIWIEGNTELYKEVRTELPTVQLYNALIADEEKTVDFIVTNNDGMSSSFLELKDHLVYHPDCLEQKRLMNQKTTTLENFVIDHAINMTRYDFLAMDIQGCEYLALKGMTSLLKHFKGIYLEVNTSEIYKDCGQLREVTAFLRQYGFEMKDIYMTPYNWGDAYFSR
jgi:FkbM family methyltransferase